MSTTVMSSSNSSHKSNHKSIRRIVSTWQRFARKKSIASSEQQGEDGEQESQHRHSHKLPDEATFVVFVGKERREYVLGEHYLQMPLFRSLLEKSKARSSGDEAPAPQPGQTFVIPCEIVMFEHLLWMLDSGSGSADQSVDELVDFYAY